ncbi:hypothetical protein AMTRI_Chr03g46900 [Amborella trichopoda]|uniref:Uncharacterized protein n=1 Tax=Amborella trichopoda TaxID=13333 RepID=W1NYE0_AMBTC|nr:protein YABBY 4 [Amborella trichopoda]ERN02637.1 hypothetical protein AMTR_s00085p00032940 [Amborella trichopoda]|eukprot:XP_006840962.3 protein YABBY 4 [Amborella trichopoda]
MSSSSSFAFHPTPSEQLCYVHCNFCDTVLAVSVPCSSLFKMVTVRCGHCTNVLSVDTRGLLHPTAATQLHLGHAFFSPTPHNLLDECSPPSSLLLDHPLMTPSNTGSASTRLQENEALHSPVSRPPEKRQRVPSAYNRFIKEEIQRIKAGNPDITHREAFSTAAKNWAHFPHIHFGLMADQSIKKTNMQDGDDVLITESFFTAANMGVTPY